jgi:nitrogen regulatory protein P-II 1
VHGNDAREEEEEAMKLVVAIIKPHQVEAVTEALDKIEVSGMTLTDVRGHGRQRGHSEVYRGGEYRVDFLPKVKVEVLADDLYAEQVANTIVDNARTGKIGDGKLWVQPVDVTVRIRTGEVGEEAL